MKAKLPAGAAPVLRSVFEESRRFKVPLFAVGGWVRDSMLGAGTDDFDLVAESDPIELARACARRFKARLEVFERFGTARVLFDRFRLDFARTRRETYSSPAALPEVELIGSLAGDLIRRDFTVNAVAAPLTRDGFDADRIIDPFLGGEDLRRKTLRVLHAESFRDDPTRLFRAARYACRFDLRLDEVTESLRRAAMSAGWPRLLTRERLRTELVCVLEERRPVRALERLRSWGLAELLHPKLSWPADMEKGRGAWERLGMTALHMGSPEGGELIASLHLERPVSQALLEALRLARDKSSPRTPIPPLTLEVLRRSLKRVRPGAWKPLCVGGSDLESLGLKPGPEFKAWLERASKAQWAGEFSTRPQGLRWLKSRLSRTR